MLYNLIIGPIETIVEWVFNFCSVKFSSFGIMGAVCGVSLVINFLALPLYNVADSLQEKERKIARELEPRVKRIKKAFKGNEQFMMLSTYYRQNDYNPLYVLRSSLSILIEIPFFIAAYHFLSNCEALHGSSFWIFKDLGSPDGLLHIGKFPIHVLPILMTLINFVSGAIYTKGGRLTEKVQLYVVAMIFLALLYTSPSGLVIYWILNNLFSLAKNIVMKMKHPGRVLHGIISLLFVLATGYFFTKNQKIWKPVLLALVTIAVIAAPFIKNAVAGKFNLVAKSEEEKNNTNYLFYFVPVCLAISLLCGFLLPASTIGSSPSEFSFLGKTASPLAYVFNSFIFYCGFFFVWPLLIYLMFSQKVRKNLCVVMTWLLFSILLNCYLLKPVYSNLNSLFELSSRICLISKSSMNLASIFLYLVLFVLVYVLYNLKIKKFIPMLLSAVCLAEFSLGIVKNIDIKKTYQLLCDSGAGFISAPKVETEISLSKNGKNVIVLFIDRAIAGMVPEIFEQYPEIKKQFSGFVYYPNTLSFSTATVEGAPGMFAGYEYTPENMNSDNGKILREKHNESLALMCRLFSDAGFSTTMTDPSWPNYHGKGDLDFYKDLSPLTKVSEISGKYYSNYKFDKGMENLPLDKMCQKGCIDFVFLECLPPFLRVSFYDSVRRVSGKRFSGATFFTQLSGLYYLPEMTDFAESNNTFTLFCNETPHEVYVTLNSELEDMAKNQTEDLYTNTLHANAAALKQLGKYFDYLRENKVFDNSRIIVVSDHGSNLGRKGSKVLSSDEEVINNFRALLIVKDFNSNAGFTENNSFMTNADTLFIAKEGLNLASKNPFTEKQFEQDKDKGINIYRCLDVNPEKHFRNDSKFKVDMNQAWHVSENIFDEKNWIPLNEWNKNNGGNK